MEAYRAHLDIAQRLSAAAPQDLGLHRHVAVSNYKIGRVLFTQGKLDAALAHFNKDLQIHKELLELDPDDHEWLQGSGRRTI